MCIKVRSQVPREHSLSGILYLDFNYFIIMKLKVLFIIFLILHSTSAIQKPTSGLSSDTLTIIEQVLEENQELKNDIKDLKSDIINLKSKVATQDDEIKDLKALVTEKVDVDTFAADSNTIT